MRKILTTSKSKEYFTKDGLWKSIGLNEDEWNYVILKELIDNALDSLDSLQSNKKISISTLNNSLIVSDSGPGISESTLDKIYDFKYTTSSTHLYRVPSRGQQGNALKTIIGICYVKGYRLIFQLPDYCIEYVPIKEKIDAGIIEPNSFKKERTSNAQTKPFGIIIEGYKGNTDFWTDLFSKYWLVNPDVTFTWLDDFFSAKCDSIPKTPQNKYCIEWYDLAAFNELIQAWANQYPDYTIKKFLENFSSTRKVLKNLSFPKKLKDVANGYVKPLYEHLRANIVEASPNVLKGIIPKFQMSGEYDLRYREKKGFYEYNEATIPYIIQGFCYKGEDDFATYWTAINNSIPYKCMPFEFNGQDIKFIGEEIYPRSGDSLVYEFSQAKGVSMWLHLITPYLQFTDRAKTNIWAEPFKEKLVSLVEYLIKPTVLELRKDKRQKAKQHIEEKPRKSKSIPKNQLMKKYFMEAFNQASGGYHVTARQVFYVLRAIINKQHYKNLTESDYAVFTQQICTDFIADNEDIEERLLFAQRGTFKSPDREDDIPLGTKAVRKHLSKTYDNSISIGIEEYTYYNFEDKYRFNQVLFIEKEGFFDVIQQSGLPQELKLGIMSTQGRSNRAARTLIKYFLDNGIKVHVLTDCDLYGYQIYWNMRDGTDTFPTPLDINHIGLTVADIKILGKEDLAEEWVYKKEKSFIGFTEEERQFFQIDYRNWKYIRRIELNALTTPELLDFIRSKIKLIPIVVPDEILKKIAQKVIVPEHIAKAASYRFLQNQVDFYKLIGEGKNLFNELKDAVQNAKSNWLWVAEKTIHKHQEEKIDELVQKLQNLQIFKK